MRPSNEKLIQMFKQLEESSMHSGRSDKEVSSISFKFLGRIAGGSAIANADCTNNACTDSNSGCHNDGCAGKNPGCSNHGCL